MIRDVIPDPDFFFPFRIQGSKKHWILDPGSLTLLFFHIDRYHKVHTSWNTRFSPLSRFYENSDSDHYNCANPRIAGIGYAGNKYADKILYTVTESNTVPMLLYKASTNICSNTLNYQVLIIQADTETSLPKTSLLNLGNERNTNLTANVEQIGS